MLLTGMLFVSGGFVSCDSDDDDVNKVNTLEVTPSSSIDFKASGNADVVLTVETDAQKWAYAAPDWIVAKQEGKTLTVNAKDNATGETRVGRIQFTAGNAQSVAINVSQRIPEEGADNVLSVEPSDAIAFEAAGNTAVVLTVATDAASWDFEAPEWITATKDGDKLTVNAQDNTEEGSRAGRLTITAGTANPVAINVSQKGAGEEPVPGDKVAGSLKNLAEEGATSFVLNGKETEPMILKVQFELAKAAAADTEVQIFVDEAYLTEYNFINKTECVLFPAQITVADGGNVKIAAGSTASAEVSVTLDVTSDQLKFNQDYLIPLYVKAKTDNVSVGSAARINYVVRKKNPKEVKNVLFYEVNDTNPLNTLEYMMADGTYFFDAVVLFAANINYDAAQDVVYLNNNPNVQALLDDTDIYLQPLREKGIKVYLGLLGNHDAAGLCQLSDWGCEQFAEEMALACKEYKLDGVNFDDEYSTAPISGNRWFAPYSSNAAGSRLCYETKKALQKHCPWETEVSLYAYGGFWSGAQAVDGHKPGEFVDFWVADYGGSTSPLDGMTMKGCSGISLQLNHGNTLSEDRARQIKEAGYGWIMYFAFTPVGSEKGSGTVPTNLSTSMETFRKIARGLYDQEMLEPTGYYLKIDNGVYDPVRHEF